MTAPTIARRTPPPPPPGRFDEKFIEENQLIERYLENRLPMKGARDLEYWCREHPEYLSQLRLPERAQASLKLLEASGQPVDFEEPRLPWWRSAYIALGLGVISLTSVLAFGVVASKYSLQRSELEDARTRMKQGSLVPASEVSTVRVSPDRTAVIERAEIVVNGGAAQLLDVHIDMSYAKAAQFRMIVDKKDQGRALIIENLNKDSNGEIRFTLNTSGLAAGNYTVRIEATQSHGAPIPQGWLALEVR